jgi:DNA-binding transcriptional ArsR family regulator
VRPDKDVTDSRLVKALAHPLRVRILGVLDDRMASPSELAEELDAPLGNVSYHVRILASLGLIRLVKETPRRGSVEHHYEAVPRPLISDEAWSMVPETVKRAMVGAALDQAGRSVAAAAAEGGFDRPEALLSRGAWQFDEEAWRAISEAARAFFEQAERLAQEAEERLAGRPGDAGTLLVMLFAGAQEGGGGEGTGPREIEDGADATSAP